MKIIPFLPIILFSSLPSPSSWATLSQHWSTSSCGGTPAVWCQSFLGHFIQIKVIFTFSLRECCYSIYFIDGVWIRDILLENWSWYIFENIFYHVQKIPGVQLNQTSVLKWPKLCFGFWLIICCESQIQC